MDDRIWNVFLPDDIIVRKARFDGLKGEATIWFQYPNHPTLHRCCIHRNASNDWVISDINKV